LSTTNLSDLPKHLIRSDKAANNGLKIQHLSTHQPVFHTENGTNTVFPTRTAQP